MTKTDPEYKNFKESYDRVVPYFTERFKHIADELIYEIFLEFSKRADEVVNVLSRNMLDFADLISFFCNSIKQINPLISIGSSTEDIQTTKTKNTFQLMIEVLANIANKLLNCDPLQTEVYFLEYGMENLV